MKIGIIRKFFNWLKGIVDKEFELVKKNSTIAIKVTSILKDIVENPVTRIITELTPNGLDNEIHAKLRTILPMVLSEMALAHGLIQQNASQAVVLEAMIAHLKPKVPNGRIGFWIELTGRVNAALSDGKITIGEGAGIAQLVYSEIYHSKQ